MLRFSDSMRTLGKAVALDTPVRFDPELVGRLLAEHRALNAQFADAIPHLGGDRDVAERAVRGCTERLVEVRRTEALWLYPVIARAIEGDNDAQQQFLRLRLVMLRLARRVLRLFDELTQAIRAGVDIGATADRAAESLAEYWVRNNAEIYPIYDLVGARRDMPARARAG